METSLHRDLKRLYAGEQGGVEVRLGAHIIDAIADDELIEIQHGKLSAIRDKIRTLLQSHRVRIVKPLIARKTLVKLAAKDGAVLERRSSPKRQIPLDLFDELVRATRLFPHPNLTIEVAMVEVLELRYPGHGRRRRWRKNDFVVQDQQLVEISETVELSTPDDLLRLAGFSRCLPANKTGPIKTARKVTSLPQQFHTADMAKFLSIPRWRAQQIAYVLRHCDALRVVGKSRNAVLYEISAQAPVSATLPAIPAAPRPIKKSGEKRKRRSAA
ncbi:MAG: hypothetical protein SGJ20_12240 [Planctomycetota bacterium]|nr:hypothetical protein [Planctomycetota bacterium]